LTHIIWEEGKTIYGDVMGEYDTILLGMPRDKAVLCLRKLGDNIEPVEQDVLDNENGELIKFQAYDFIIYLFKEKDKTETFIYLLRKWLGNVSWSKKLIASRSIEEVDCDGILKKLHVLQVRIWVSDEHYANYFKIAANVIRDKLFLNVYDSITAGKKLSAMFRSEGWRCKCGYLNAVNDSICANCLSFLDNDGLEKYPVLLN
jgi:hypothetical protein